jgi:hypothetical protein
VLKKIKNFRCQKVNADNLSQFHVIVRVRYMTKMSLGFPYFYLSPDTADSKSFIQYKYKSWRLFYRKRQICPFLLQ